MLECDGQYLPIDVIRIGNIIFTRIRNELRGWCKEM